MHSSQCKTDLQQLTFKPRVLCVAAKAVIIISRNARVGTIITDTVCDVAPCLHVQANEDLVLSTYATFNVYACAAQPR